MKKNHKIEIEMLAKKCYDSATPKNEYYAKYNVKRGLRDIGGHGVLVGITDISEVNALRMIKGKEVPIDGELFYRGYNIKDLVKGIGKSNHFGYEEALYLLLFGELPTREDLDDFLIRMSDYRELPPSFVRDILMMSPSNNIMNLMARSVLTLYSYDSFAEDISVPNVLRQCLQLTSIFPLLAVYGYQIFRHYADDCSLVIHPPKAEYSTAENFLYLLRADGKFTSHEAKLLDTCLMLHMEHGGGNNSTFTTHMVTSSGTDTYSTIAASLGSLKGSRHGGANHKVVAMMEDLKKNVTDWNDEEQIKNYLVQLLNKNAFDKSGLIYGMGHAVYSLSDPREEILRKLAKTVSNDKGKQNEYNLYATVAKLAPEVIAKERQIFKGVSPNVDFFSGYVYHLLDIPEELYTPLFAIARIAGWSAHRIEELISGNKIIRPAYMSVLPHKKYVPIDER